MSILIYGLINSAIYIVFAIGFSLVYGIARIPNFAHGAIYVLAGYMIWIFTRSLGIPYPISFALSVIVVVVVNVAMYRLLVVRIRGMKISEILITYAFGMGILETLRFGGLVDIKFSLKPLISGLIHIGGIPIDFQRIIIVGTAAIAIFALWIFTHKTRIGLAFRAIAQDEQAALILGIDSDMIASTAMAVSSLLLAFSAALIFPLGDIRVDAGYDVLIFSLAICIVGGLGSWWGTVLAAFIFGFAQVLTAVYVSSSFTMVTVFALLLLVLVIKPSGLMGKQREIEERV